MTDTQPARSRRRDGGRPPGSTRWRTVRRVAYGLVGLAIIGPIVAFMVAYLLVDVPQPSDLKANQVATIYAQDGNNQIARIVPPEGNRTDVTIEQIPTSTRFAVLAAEDRSFYSNPGFSITGTARAALNNVRGGERQGGSTITQQYVKNAMVGDEQTLVRKFRELVISTKLAQQTSKDDILAAYLNTIYFGRGSYGIASASQAYFGKESNALTVAEGAVLASTIRSPSALDPTDHPEAAEQRWSLTLDAMVQEGWLTPDERAAQVYPKVLPPADPDMTSGTQGPSGLIVRQVRSELVTAGISEQQLNTEGLQITTTIDPKAQQAAEASAAKTLGGQPPNLRAAVVSVDPRSGAVRAYYGGPNGSGLDYAQSTSRPPGSSFKVFDVAAALKKGISLNKTYDGSTPQTIAGQKITNSEGASCGRCTLATALKLSLNTVFYQLTVDVGPQAVADVAHAAGVPTVFPDTNQRTLQEADGPPNAGIGLGSYPVRPIDMAAAYATLADNGIQHDPYFVQKVVTADGNVLLDRGLPQGTRAIDDAIAKNVTAAMEPIAAYSRNHNLAGGRESAAKTGTNQLGETGNNRDAWMVGFTPSLSTAVWVGSDGDDPIKTSGGANIYGSGLPSDIWKSTMDGALQGTPQERFPNAPALNGGSGGVPAETSSATRSTGTTTRPSTTTSTPAPTTTAPTTTPTPTPTTTAPTTTRAPSSTTSATTTTPRTTTRTAAPGPTTTLPAEAEDD